MCYIQHCTFTVYNCKLILHVHKHAPAKHVSMHNPYKYSMCNKVRPNHNINQQGHKVRYQKLLACIRACKRFSITVHIAFNSIATSGLYFLLNKLPHGPYTHLNISTSHLSIILNTHSIIYRTLTP